MRRRTPVLAAFFVALAASVHASAPPAGAAPATTLSVSLLCYPDGQWCEATASGGNGGYTFEWEWPVVEQYDADGYSWGDVACYPYWGWRTISVAVTDANSSTAYASTSFFCPA